MSKTINCDQVIHLQNALDRYASLAVVVNQWPGIARDPYSATNQVACLFEIMEVFGVVFADEAARDISLYKLRNARIDKCPPMTSPAQKPTTPTQTGE